MERLLGPQKVQYTEEWDSSGTTVEQEKSKATGECNTEDIWAEIKLASTPSSELVNVTHCCLIYLPILPKSYVAVGLPTHTLLVAFL